MKIAISSHKNPDFLTNVEYTETAFSKIGDIRFYNNKDFIFPGRLRDRISYLQDYDIKRMNKKYIDMLTRSQPDIFLEIGGVRILPETVRKINSMNIKTVLWTTDVPWYFDNIIKSAELYDQVFCAGSEAIEILKSNGIQNVELLPFACDPEYHKPQLLTDKENTLYAADVVFVGSVHPSIYSARVDILNSISGFNLNIWGPGVSELSKNPQLNKAVRGERTHPEVWRKIFSAAKINLCMHYRDPEGRIPCYQASPRVFEALSCGSFLVVDAERDVLDIFEEGKDLRVFRTKKELRDIIDYYLNNETERIKIAQTGREKVIKYHSYDHRVMKIMQKMDNIKKGDKGYK